MTSGTPVDDRELLEQSRGAPELFTQLFDRHAPAVHERMAADTDPRVADEMLAPAFVAAFEGRREDPAGDVGEWLVNTATRVARRRRRRRRRAAGRSAGGAVARGGDGGGADPVETDPVEAARAMLVERIAWESASPGARPRVRARRRALAVVASIAAVGILGTLALTDVVGLGVWRGGADAAASSVIRTTADAAEGVPPPVVGAGQYQRVEIVELHTGGILGEGDTMSGWRQRSSTAIFIPADREDTWTEIRLPAEFVEAVPIARESGIDLDDIDNLERVFGDTTMRRGQADDFASPTFPLALDRLPRDPVRLLNRIYRESFTRSPWWDESVFEIIANLVARETTPHDLRVPLLRALLLVPGVTLTGPAEIRDQTGIAIGRDSALQGIRTELVLDPSAGEVIGLRKVRLDLSDLGDPPGAVVGWVTSSSSVVDDVPAR